MEASCVGGHTALCCTGRRPSPSIHILTQAPPPLSRPPLLSSTQEAIRPEVYTAVLVCIDASQDDPADIVKALHFGETVRRCAGRLSRPNTGGGGGLDGQGGQGDSREGRDAWTGKTLPSSKASNEDFHSFAYAPSVGTPVGTPVGRAIMMDRSFRSGTSSSIGRSADRMLGLY